MFLQSSFYMKYKVLEDLSNPPPSTSTAYGKTYTCFAEGFELNIELWSKEFPGRVNLVNNEPSKYIHFISCQGTIQSRGPETRRTS